jgi:hypothetical protein
VARAARRNVCRRIELHLKSSGDDATHSGGEKEHVMQKLQQIAFSVIVVYLWTMMILLGAIVLETFMVYPNIFHDPPGSLEFAMEFMAVRAPNDFFPPLGFLSWVAGAGALALGWHVRPVRWWILLSVLMIVAEGVVSMLFMWPRNEIMFVEGTAVHSAEVLRQTAQEFQALHWSRLAFNAASAAFAFVGFLAIYRERVLAQAAASNRDDYRDHGAVSQLSPMAAQAYSR